MVAHFPLLRPESNENAIMLKKTVTSPSICLITLYGGDVEVYTTEALMFRANYPESVCPPNYVATDQGHVFPPEFHPEFNQYVPVRTSLLLDRFEALNRSINDFGSYPKNPREAGRICYP